MTFRPGRLKKKYYMVKKPVKFIFNNIHIPIFRKYVPIWENSLRHNLHDIINSRQYSHNIESLTPVSSITTAFVILEPR